MKRKFFIKSVAVLLVMMTFIMTATTTVKADALPGFAVGNVSDVEKNTSFNVNVSFNSDSAVAVNGISLVLKYDAEKIKYVQNSVKALNTNISNFNAYGKSGEVIFVWDSLTSVSLSTGNILRFTFEALEELDDSGTTIEIVTKQLYVVKGTQIIDITFGANTSGTIGGQTDSSVAAVEEKITAIGTVEYTEASKARIDDAWNAYCALPSAKRLLVSNYDILVEAMKKYEELQQADAQNPINQEVADYKAAHAYALSLTKYNATTEKLENGDYKDLKAIENALAELEKLSTSAQAQLMSSKYTMKSVQAYLEALLEEEKEAAEEAEREAAQKAAAEEAVAEYNSQPFKWVFDLTTDTVKSDDETGVREALNALGNFEINEYAIEMLAPKKELLNNLLKKIEELQIAENPEDAEYIQDANEFKNKFSYILGLTPETLSADDEVDLYIVYYMYEMLDEGTKKYLTSEGELLSKLMDTIGTLESEDDSDVSETDTEIIEKEKTVVKYVSNGKTYEVKLLSRTMSQAVWILLIIIAVLAVNFVVCYVLFRRAKRKYGERGLENGKNKEI